jgi:GT2 family glycosyltransferase
MPAILSKKQAPAWERIGLAPLPESVLDETVRVPLARWHPRQLPLWERLEGIPLPANIIIGTEAHLAARTIAALAGRLRPDTRLILAGRPAEADHSLWESCRPLGFGLWLCTGLYQPSLPATVEKKTEVLWPRISVVTISYNQAAFLEATLRSVLEQDYPNLEYIVIDGGSNDGSQEILERYRSQISTLIIEPDKGQSDALCKGFALATGDILTWLCSDDLLEPGALRHVADAFTRFDVDIIAGGCRVIDTAGNHKLLHHNGLPFETPVPLSFGDLAGFLGVWQKTMYFFQPELFFTRRLWDASGGFIKHHLHYAMDYDLFLRFAMAAPQLVHISQTLAASRMHDAQKTQHQSQEYLPTIRLILREYRALVAALAEQTFAEDRHNMS